MKRVVEELRERERADARLVFLVDEVDAVLPDPDPEGDSWLDTLLAECSEEVRVVLAGVNGRGSRRGAPGRLQARLEDVALEPLRPDDARALVTRPVAHCFRYEPHAVERIVQLARGRPYLVQKLCLDAVNRMLDEGRTTVHLADVEPPRSRNQGAPAAAVGAMGDRPRGELVTNSASTAPTASGRSACVNHSLALA